MSTRNFSITGGNPEYGYSGTITTTISVSGSRINWTVVVSYNSSYAPNKTHLGLWDSNDPAPWNRMVAKFSDERSGSYLTFSGYWNADKTSGTITFRLQGDPSSGSLMENDFVWTETYSGATIYTPPTCSVSLWSGSVTPGVSVTLGLSATGNLTSGVLRRFYKAPGASNYTQTNIRAGLTNSSSQVSDEIPASSNGGKIYWDYTVSDGTNTVSAQTAIYTIVSNSAPSIPASLTIPNEIAAGSSFSITWGSSTDPDGNFAGYLLERSVNGGITWTQVYKGTSRSTTDTLIAGTARVRYRVSAYDTYDAQSGYRPAPSTGDITVSNNHAPTIPAPPITVTPASLMVGVQAVISWGQSTDEDGDSFEYVLERSVDNLTSYAEIYRGTTRNYTDAVGSWSTVTYRVKAVDSHGAASGYLTAETKVVSTNSAPTITCSYTDGEDLGTKSAVFSFTYQVNDENAADTLTVKEIVDGVVKKTIDNAVRNQNYTFNFLAGSAASSSYWNKVLNGSHTITISVSDGAVTVSKTFTFLKNVGACLITMAEAITSARNIDKVAVSICGNIPAGGFTAVQVTADDGTHWEDCVLASGTGVTESGIGNRKKKATGALTEELLGGHYLFIHTMTNTGKKFNFRIQAEKVGDEGGFISSVQGTFTEASA